MKTCQNKVNFFFQSLNSCRLKTSHGLCHVVRVAAAAVAAAARPMKDKLIRQDGHTTICTNNSF